jgi:hypothetical protein
MDEAPLPCLQAENMPGMADSRAGDTTSCYHSPAYLQDSAGLLFTAQSFSMLNWAVANFAKQHHAGMAFTVE